MSRRNGTLPAPRRSRPPDLEERARIVASFDATRFTLRGANDLSDDAGVKYGDRVEVRLFATCVDVVERTSREGPAERSVVLETYAGEIVSIIDEAIISRRPKRRRRRLSVVKEKADG